jgi:hypothetical protein
MPKGGRRETIKMEMQRAIGRFRITYRIVWYGTDATNNYPALLPHVSPATKIPRASASSSLPPRKYPALYLPHPASFAMMWRVAGGRRQPSPSVSIAIAIAAEKRHGIKIRFDTSFIIITFINHLPCPPPPNLRAPCFAT